MHILFFADNFPPERNAQAARVYERACYWVHWKHQAAVITCAPNFPEGQVFPGYRNRWRSVESMNGIRVVRVKTYIAPNAGKYRRILDFVSYMLAGLVAGLFTRRPDVVAATSPQFFGALGACLAAAARRLPFVLEVSDLWPDSIVAVGAMKRGYALRALEKIELWMYRRAVRIVTLTSSFKQNLVSRGIDAGKIAVVINGVELNSYAPRDKDLKLAASWGLAEQHFVVGYIGTHGMAHDLENVLQAAARAADPNLRFLFVGAGAERDRLVTQAREMGLDNVIFVPAQPKAAMPSYWSLCDLALVHLKNTPLFATVIPSKIFEAMGMGLPILLAAPEGEASDLIAKTGAGIWVPPGQPRQLLEAIHLLRRNPDLHRRLASCSRAAAPQYSRERQAREMLAALTAAATPQLRIPALTHPETTR
ncbi:MAG: glycosyltransferase family 4 protein [Chlamydiota bacterium]